MKEWGMKLMGWSRDGSAIVEIKMGWVQQVQGLLSQLDALLHVEQVGMPVEAEAAPPMGERPGKVKPRKPVSAGRAKAAGVEAPAKKLCVECNGSLPAGKSKCCSKACADQRKRRQTAECVARRLKRLEPVKRTGAAPAVDKEARLQALKDAQRRLDGVEP
jgi:hypothetical protein